MTFSSLSLRPEILRAVEAKGYETPTPIQAQAIPIVLQGRDLIAGAQTGTGKTAAFTLPLLQILSTSSRRPGSRSSVRALILTPTRELALQVEESVKTYGANLGMKSAAVFGGVNINPQVRALRSGLDILVATPGRLLDHYGQGTVDFSSLEVLILDEADRMLDMGFIRDIKKILGLLPPRRQNLLFSATFGPEIRALAEGLLKDPVSVDVAPRNSAAVAVTHRVIPVDRVRKTEALIHLIKEENIQQVLVFTRTKHMANSVADSLTRSGIPALAIHGNKSQARRVQALGDFKGYKIQALVATDIAARGLDIEQLPHVINYELPHVSEDYVHRSGRTGRAGSTGDAISLVCIDEAKLLKDIEKLMKKNLPGQPLPGFEPDPRIPAEPIINGRSGRSGGPRTSPRAPHNHESHHRSAKPGTPRPSGSGSPRSSSSGNPRSSSSGNSSGESRSSLGFRGRGSAPSRSEGRFGPRDSGRNPGSRGGRA